MGIAVWHDNYIVPGYNVKSVTYTIWCEHLLKFPTDTVATLVSKWVMYTIWYEHLLRFTTDTVATLTYKWERVIH
jgi:hypothetical protein